MKKYIIILTAAIFAASVFASCNKEQSSSMSGNICNFTVTTSGIEGPTRTVLSADGTKLLWEDGDAIAIIAGNTTTVSSSNTIPANACVCKLSQYGRPGVFAGTVDLGTYSASDIKGVVYPYSSRTWYRRNNSYDRIVMQVGATASAGFDQVQKRNNVLNGENAPMFAVVSASDLTKDGETYIVEGKQFKWSCALLKFLIYGGTDKTRDDEVFKSISLGFTDDSTKPSVGIVGNVEWDTSQEKFVANASKSSIPSASLEEEVTVKGKTADNGVMLYMALMPRGAGTTVQPLITVKTDKASYVYQLPSKKTLNLVAGHIIPVKLDLSKFARTPFEPEVETSENFSTDGGKTWSDKAPTASDTFSSLIIKDILISTDAMKGIASAMAAQSSPVELDMSGCTFESNVFPKSVFHATVDAPCTALKSIRFPKNVTSIEDGAKEADGAFAYCTALESVDLSTLTSIGIGAFYHCGLKSVSVPKTVTSVGQSAFRWCTSLTDIYYDCPAASGAYIFAIQDANADEYTDVNLTLTVGPDVTSIPANFIRSNGLLKKIVFESSPSLGGTCFSKSRYIDIIECKTSTPPSATSSVINSTAGTATGEMAKSKVIYVPAGSKAAYEASKPLGTEFVTTLGYTVVEQ